MQCDPTETKAYDKLTSTAQYVSVLVVDVLMDHVALALAPAAQQSLGFAGSLATTARARQDGGQPDEPTSAAFISFVGSSVSIGTVDTPYLNLVTCGVIGAVGIVAYIGASCMPSFDPVKAVIYGYDNIMPPYEHEHAQLLQSRPSTMAKAFSLMSFPSNSSQKQGGARNGMGRGNSSGGGAGRQNGVSGAPAPV